MSSGQQRAVAAVAGVIVVVAVALGAVAVAGGDGGDGDREGAAGVTSTAAPPTTSTTAVLAPVTTLAGATPTTGAPTTTTAEHTEVDGTGAVLSRPSRDEIRSRPPGGGCAALALPGYSARCGELEDGADTYVWLVERNAATGGVRASVLRQAGDRRFLVVLAAVDDGPAGPARFSSVEVDSEDLSGDGTPELVFGFRNQGSGALLDVDVVDAPGRVVVHRTLDKGRAVVAAGRLEVWSAEFGPGDAACCPSRYRHGVIRYADRAWRLVSSGVVPAADVPDGDL